MDLNEFSNKIKQISKDININIDDEQAEKFYNYMNSLLEWNEKINLTAITEPDDIIIKHFIDSLTINRYIQLNKSLIDIGTGAGFPGIPLGLIRADSKILLVDSLNKRVNFLGNVCNSLQLKNISTKHARVEELAHDLNYREKFDYATSRAVAPLNVLLEYMLPFIKNDGYCICMKSSNASIEIEQAKKALDVLGGKIERVDEFNLPGTDMNRTIIIVKKIKNTLNKYPRKPGTPSKDPIV